MAGNFKLPGSSYEELIKIIKAYAAGKVGIPMSLETVSQTAKMDKTIVSRNNGFLMQLGYISEGNKKSLTQLGSDLGRAYDLNMSEQIVSIWRNVIEADEFLNRMLAALRIRNGMEKSEFVNHILYSSGSNNNNNTRTGANTIIEIYKVAKLVAEEDGKIIPLNEEIEANATHAIQSNNTPFDEISSMPVQTITTSRASINISINLNITLEDFDILPEKIKNFINSINEVS